MSSTEQQKNDSTLVAEILDGERDLFEELVLRYQKMVYAIAWSQLGSGDLAEEASQQAFVKAYCYLATLRDTTKFRPWLAQIAKNVSVSLGRKRHREISNCDRWHLHPSPTDADVSTKRLNLSEELGESLAGLRDIHRQVLTLFYLEGQSVKEVSAILDLSESSVKTRLNRARKALRYELEKRLADALDELKPSHNLSSLVMLGLPSGTPLGASIKLAATGKTSSTFAKLGSLAWINLIALVPFGVALSLSAKGQAANFYNGKEHDFRRKIALLHPFKIIFMAIVIFLVAGLLSQNFGSQHLFLAIGVFCLYSLWQAIRFLRVNSSAYSKAIVIVLALQAIACLLIGFLNVHFVVFLVAMTIANLALYFSRDSMPHRRDYNLFLRAATGGLGVTEQGAHRTKKSDSAELEKYAKFLGEQWLIRDYVLDNDCLRIFLPPSGTGIFKSMLPPQIGSSQAILSSTGTCEAFLEPSDAKNIQMLTQTKVDCEQLTVKVELALEHSLQLLNSNSAGAARKHLCRIEDGQVFKKRPSETKAIKWLFIFSIGCGVMAAVAFAISTLGRL